MKQLILLLMLSLSSICFSQDTAKLRSREITKYLAEGLEAKEILKIRNAQLRSKDSLIATKSQIDSLNKQLIGVLKEENSGLKRSAQMCEVKVKVKNKAILGLLIVAVIEGVVIFLK